MDQFVKHFVDPERKKKEKNVIATSARKEVYPLYILTHTAY